MMGARKAGLLHRLVNDQTLPGILAKMPPADWCQWAKERPTWMREAVEEAFWNFVDQKWRDALNVAAAEPPAWGTGVGGKTVPPDGGKKAGAVEATKLAKAAVHMTGVDGKWQWQGDSGRACVFKEVMGCPATHPPWHCKVFGKLPAKEREKLIKDNQLCPFCLLHDMDKPCGAKQKPVACTTSNCKGRHIQELHEFLKDMFREENQVHVVHGDEGWEESEEAWELVEEEMMIVGTVQQEDGCTWQDPIKPWIEEDEEMAVGSCQVGTCQGKGGVAVETREEAAGQPPTSQCKGVETAEAEWQAPGPDDLLLEGEEGEYFLELLMRKESPKKPKEDRPVEAKEDRKSKAASTRGKDEKKDRKKALKESKAGASGQGAGKSAAGSTGNQGKPAASDLLSNPEAKGRGLVTGGQ
jgi:hypothetical protein